MLILKKGQKIENYITFMKFTDPLYSIILWFSLSFQRRHIIVFKSTFKSIFKNTFHQLGWSVHTSMKRMIRPILPCFPQTYFPITKQASHPYFQLVKKTRMKTSISSKAFCSITDRQTNKYLHNRCSFMTEIKKNLSDIRENHVSP